MLIINDPRCQDLIKEAGTKAQIWYAVGYTAGLIDKGRQEMDRLQQYEDDLFAQLTELLNELRGEK